MLQPAGYNATRRAVLLTVAIGPLDPSSRIELGSVSYYYVLLLSALVCVMDATGIAVPCCPAAIDPGSNSKAAVPLSEADEGATVRTQPVLSLYYMCNAHCCCLYCVVELNDTLSFPASISTPAYHTRYAFNMHQVPGTRYHWCKKSFVRIQSFTHQVSHIPKIEDGTRYQVLPGVLSNLCS